MSEKTNILVVDDSPSNLAELRAALASLGQNLVEAHSGEEALRVLREGDYAVVLLEARMQPLDGHETIRGVRAEERSRHTPVIFLTSVAPPQGAVEQAYALGAVDYLVRPVIPAILRAKVDAFVQLFRRTEEVRRQGERLRELERRQADHALAGTEARSAAVVAAALDGIITIDHDGRIIEFNPAAERVFGYRGPDVLGREIAELLIPPGLRERHQLGLSRHLATGESTILGRRIEMPALRADGVHLLIELAITRVPTDGPPLFTAFVRDITERKRGERRRAAKFAVAQVLTRASTAAAALDGVLEAVCESVDWDVGAIWEVDRPAGVLRCVRFWHKRNVAVPEFAAATWQKRFERGVGLPGRVWSNGVCAWIPDVVADTNFPRASIAAREGLHGAFGFPLLLGRETVGVIEFFSRSVEAPDDDLLVTMATVGAHLGQFLARKRAEEERLASEQRFARFMQHLPGLAWIKDLAGRYVFANDPAMKAFRTQRARLYGRTDEEVFPLETARQFKANDRDALTTPTGVQVVETLEQGDGVMHYSLVSKFPIPGPDGTPALVGGMAIDITDRLQAEAALRSVRENLQIVTDSMAAPVTRCSRDLTYLWVSKAYADMVRLPADEIIGRPIVEVIGPEAFQAIKPRVEEVLSGRPVRYDEMVEYPGQAPRWISAVYTPTFDSAGATDGWVAVIIDIDARKRVEQALKEADRRKDEFLAMLAHELRNPLAPVRNALHIMRMPGVDADTVRLARDLMDRQTSHLVRMVDDLLDVSRIMRNRVELRKERLDLASVFTAAVETARPLIDAQGHQLSVSLPPRPILLEGDPVRLSQVVSNLLVNAAKYSDGPGRISLTGEADGAEAVIRVRDTGVGIDAQLLPHVFDLFTQADRSLARSRGGLGIGLTVVKHLVELHGGSVRAASRGIGEGSEFTVRLPALPSSSSPTRPSGEEARPAAPSRRVLVVDDNLDAAESTAMLLRMLGHEVETAHDGPAALGAVGAFRPDVVLLDIGLPGMSGYDVARALRSRGEHERLVLVAVTGYGQPEDRRSSRDAGFDHHLVKPVAAISLQALFASLPNGCGPGSRQGS